MILQLQKLLVVQLLQLSLLAIVSQNFASRSSGCCWACTDVLVTPEATEDGSSMIAYNADSGAMMGLLYHYPPTSGKGGDERPIFEWDTGKYLGTVREANSTYNVVGNVNEHGLCIGESTFGGVEALAHQEGAILDYGSLIYITLQRCKTARKAIQTMVQLMDEYGYASEGESFSIADRYGEVWIMEVIGRGTSFGKLGAVFVARRIPPGYVSAHANQARIQTFPRDDPDNCLYSEDVVDVAIHYGLFSPNDNPSTFSFSDVYCPVTAQSARLSEARVWSAFSAIADDTGKFQQQHVEYISGRNIAKRMPLWIRPYKKLSLMDVMSLMNSHYENTELDSTLDVGAGVYDAPYRPRPLVWSHEGKNYHNERTIGTQQTGWNFVAQIRSFLPPELSAITWFAVDDSSTAPRVPIYASSRRISAAYYGKGAQDGVPEPLLQFDLGRAFWVQNMVSNFAYTRWADIYPVLREKIDVIHLTFKSRIEEIDAVALEIYNGNHRGGGGIEESIEYVTHFSVTAADGLHAEWLQFYGELFVRFRDFFEIVPSSDPSEAGALKSGCRVMESGLSEEWKHRIVEATGDHYVIDTSHENSNANVAQLKSVPDNKQPMPRYYKIEDQYVLDGESESNGKTGNQLESLPDDLRGSSLDRVVR